MHKRGGPHRSLGIPGADRHSLCIKAAILRQIGYRWTTSYKRGDGHRGYVWVACTPVAMSFVWFAYNRSSTVLTEHFDWLRGKPTVCDGMPGYPSALTDIIQRCFVHLLRKAEELAVATRIRQTRPIRHDARTVRGCQKDQGPCAVHAMALSQRAHGIVTSYEDGKVRTHLLNALPDMFTFLSYPGMPPHNNDTVRAIRDGIIPQRNSRHKTMNARCRKTLSMLLTFALTCAKQDVSPGRGLLECLLDSDWDLFDKAEETPYSLQIMTGSRGHFNPIT